MSETVTENDQLWKINRKLGGRPLMFKKPSDLWDAFIKYVEWVDAHPFTDRTITRKGNKASVESQILSDRVVPRPYTLSGFLVYVGSGYTWPSFKVTYDKKSMFHTVITRIELYVRNNQVEGAMAGHFNANIVARINGISEQVKTEVSGSDGKSMLATMTIEEMEEEIKRIAESVKK